MSSPLTAYRSLIQVQHRAVSFRDCPWALGAYCSWQPDWAWARKILCRPPLSYLQNRRSSKLCNLLHFPFTATNRPNTSGSWWLVYLVRNSGIQHTNILINAQQQHRQDPTLMAALGTEVGEKTEHCWGWPSHSWVSHVAKSRKVESAAQYAGHPSPTTSYSVQTKPWWQRGQQQQACPKKLPRASSHRLQVLFSVWKHTHTWKIQVWVFPSLKSEVHPQSTHPPFTLPSQCGARSTALCTAAANSANQQQAFSFHPAFTQKPVVSSYKSPLCLRELWQTWLSGCSMKQYEAVSLP